MVKSETQSASKPRSPMLGIFCATVTAHSTKSLVTETKNLRLQLGFGITRKANENCYRSVTSLIAASTLYVHLFLTFRQDNKHLAIWTHNAPQWIFWFSNTFAAQLDHLAHPHDEAEPLATLDFLTCGASTRSQCLRFH